VGKETNSTLNRIWKELHAGAGDESSNPADMTLFKRGTTWQCNAGCDTGCRKMKVDDEELDSPANTI